MAETLETGHEFNPTNGTRYKGINVVNLLSRGYGDSRWMTDRQAQIRGYQVRRNEKGTQVRYWRFDEERKINDSNGRPVIDANGEPRTEKVRLERPQVFIAYVFNAEQFEGVPPAPSRECPWNPFEKAEQLMEAANPKLHHAAGDRAFTDRRRIPSSCLLLPNSGPLFDDEAGRPLTMAQLDHFRLGTDQAFLMGVTPTSWWGFDVSRLSPFKPGSNSID
jgi:antirestriction protein ArdC